ncbi:Uncharacterised protein [Legionella sainthelensi]|nr:Uncharacterised protein [Legionella sainthelensi]
MILNVGLGIKTHFYLDSFEVGKCEFVGGIILVKSLSSQSEGK